MHWRPQRRQLEWGLPSNTGILIPLRFIAAWLTMARKRWNHGSPGSDSSYGQHSSSASAISEDVIPLSLSPHSLLPIDLRLLNHWSTHLAPALNTSTADSFCYFITPMALSPQRPPALYHALLALSAAHIAIHDPTLDVVALREQQRAIKLLKGMVESNDVDEEALATVLMLRIFEVSKGLRLRHIYAKNDLEGLHGFP